MLTFKFDGVPVATAVVDRIERPGLSECSGTGRFRSGWKVYWKPETFRTTAERKANGPCEMQSPAWAECPEVRGADYPGGSGLDDLASRA